MKEKKKRLSGRESNPGRPRDRRKYSPLYYRRSPIFNFIIHKDIVHHVETKEEGSGACLAHDFPSCSISDSEVCRMDWEVQVMECCSANWIVRHHIELQEEWVH